MIIVVSQDGVEYLPGSTCLLQCSYCLKEAQYNCCWNANYCNEVCQQAHWPEHMDSCTQVQHQVQAGRATPAAAQTPTQKTTPLMTAGGVVQQQQQQQLSPTLAIGGGSSGGATGVPSQGLVGGPPTQDPQQGYLYTGAAAAAAQAQSQAQAQAQTFAQAQAQAQQAQQMLAQQPGAQGGVSGGPQGGGSGQQGRMSPMAMVNHTPGNTAQVSLEFRVKTSSLILVFLNTAISSVLSEWG